MRTYLNFLQYILDHGVAKSDRTGVGVYSIFGYDMRFDLEQGFPLLTTKKIHLRSIIYELLWFLRGDTNIHYLNEKKVTIWDEWADTEGELGPIYGKQWRQWRTAEGTMIDQIDRVTQDIKNNPSSRRLIVSAWNVGDLDKMALPPCHLLFQFYVANRRLSCKLTQRSADAFLGVPFNIASYALLLKMMAEQCDLLPGELIWSGGDCHIYTNHLAQVREQLSRQPYTLPTLQIKNVRPAWHEYEYKDFEIMNYHAYPAIRAPIAV